MSAVRLLCNLQAIMKASLKQDHHHVFHPVIGEDRHRTMDNDCATYSV